MLTILNNVLKDIRDALNHIAASARYLKEVATYSMNVSGAQAPKVNIGNTSAIAVSLASAPTTTVTDTINSPLYVIGSFQQNTINQLPPAVSTRFADFCAR